MIDKDLAVATVTEEGAAEGADIRGRPNPARRLGIELAESLKVSVLDFGEQFDAYGASRFDDVSTRFMFFAGIQGIAVIAQTAATHRTLRRAVTEKVLARNCVLPNHVRLASGRLHGGKRSECGWVFAKPVFNLLPGHALVSGMFFFEAGMEGLKQSVLFRWVHGFRGAIA